MIRKTGAADGRITVTEEDGREIPSPDGFSVTTASAWSQPGVWGQPDEEGLAAENQEADE